jgi:hypothetical protein
MNRRITMKVASKDQAKGQFKTVSAMSTTLETI